MIGYEYVVDAMLFEARVAMLDGEMLEVEPSQFSDCMTHVMEKLRQAEKDAARYRWLRDTGCFEGSAGDLFHATPAETDAEFDRFMQCER